MKNNLIDDGIQGGSLAIGHYLYASNDSNFRWNDIKNEIDDYHPFVLTLTTPSPFEENHSVAGIGYYMDFYSGNKDVIVYDSEHSYSVFIAYGNWGNGTTVTWVN